MMKKMGRVLLSLALTAALAVGMLTISFADRVSVSPEAERMFIDAYKVFSPPTAFSSLAEFYEKYGEENGNQCANCVNYYYDTGDVVALNVVRDLAKGRGADSFAPALSYTPKAQDPTPSEAPAVTDVPFPDVPADAWYAQAVSDMKNSGIIMGCDDGLFHPEREVTEAEFYVMLMRAATFDGANITGGKPAGDHWASGVLALAKTLYYRPPCIGSENPPIPARKSADDFADRAEAVSRIWHLHYNALNGHFTNKSYKALWDWTMTRERTEGNMAFEDIPDYKLIMQYGEVDSEVYDSRGYRTNRILYAYNHGICKGVDEAGNFNPYGTLTRAEAAQMFANAKITTRLNVEGTYGPGFDFRSTENVFH